MLRLLGRHTSGNVQKVIFLLEEMGAALQARGLRAPVQQHPGRGLPEAQSRRQGADAGRRRHGRSGNRTPSCAISRPSKGSCALSGRARARAARSSAGWTGCWPPEPPLCRRSSRIRRRRRPSAPRASRRDAKELAAQLSIARRRTWPGKAWSRRQGLHHRRYRAGADRHRCLDFPIELPALTNLKAWRERIASRGRLQEGDGRVADDPPQQGLTRRGSETGWQSSRRRSRNDGPRPCRRRLRARAWTSARSTSAPSSARRRPALHRS